MYLVFLLGTALTLKSIDAQVVPLHLSVQHSSGLHDLVEFLVNTYLCRFIITVSLLVVMY